MDVGQAVRGQYDELMTNMRKNANHPYIQEHREKLFGYFPDIDKGLSAEYTIEGIIESLPAGQSEWDRLSNSQRAKKIARLQIKNMIETLRADERITDSNKKSAAAKAETGKRKRH